MSTYMKKMAISLAVLGVAMWMPSISSAAFTSTSKFPLTAQVVFTAAGSATMSAPILHLIADNSVVTTGITWGPVTLPVTTGSGWVRSADYIEVNSVITASNGGIQIYTDNTHGTPPFTGNVLTTDPSGLVDSTNGSLRLPVAWSIKDAGIAGILTTPPVATEPNHASLVPLTDLNSPQWIYIADTQTHADAATNTAAFANGGPNSEVLDGAIGIHAASGAAPAGFFGAGSGFPKTYIYTQANFGAASTPRTYATSTLTLESFTQ